MQRSPPPVPDPRPILFFDGACGFCNASVRRFARLDAAGRVAFAPLQGDVARQRIGDTSALLARDGSIVLWEPSRAGRIRRRSDAILAALGYLPAPWRWARWLTRVPALTTVADALLYGPIARRRHRWSGGAAACPLPEPWLRERFVEGAADRPDQAGTP